MPMVNIRDESPNDRGAVFEVNASAFDTDFEARLVDALRRQADPVVSLVAEMDGRVVGHILFSPVSVDGAAAEARRMGLAPMAVHPDLQNRGVGSSLVRRGLEACRELGTELVFVLGHRDYYPRFGFRPAAPEGLHYVDADLDPYFFVLELTPGALKSASGSVEYHPAFTSLDDRNAEA